MDLQYKKSEQSKKQKFKILNIEAETTKGLIKLQAVRDVKYLYQLIKNYFEQELLINPKELTSTKHLQGILNKKAKDISSLNEFSFDNDIRVIELAVLLGVLETLHRVGGLSKEYVFVPAWQLPNQAAAMKDYSGKESWDGFLLGLSSTNGRSISRPLELKSLMTNPNRTVVTNPNGQLKERLKKFKKHFQHSGSINCVLVMPYTKDKHLSIDLKDAANDLRSTISSESAGFVCMLSFPYDKKGRLAMSILFALVSQDPLFMTVYNHTKWMCEINFGRTS